MQEQNIEKILLTSAKLNKKVVSVIRCNILILLYRYEIDGLEYRELKSLLGLSDGNLISNIRYLLKVQYVEKKTMEVNQNKSIDIYKITPTGKEAFSKVLDWMNELVEVKVNGKGSVEDKSSI